MIKLGIYSIRDTKADVFLPPFFVRTNGEALRAFDDCVQNPDTNLAKHPEDFHLFKIGYFDQDNGILEPCSCPESLASALDFVKQIKSSQSASFETIKE